MFRLGINPYGLAYAVGLQGVGASRVNPAPIGMTGFLEIAREIGAASIEFDQRWLAVMTDAELTRLGAELAAEGRTAIVSAGLTHEAGETLDEAIRSARRVGAPLIRLGLSPVLEGARSRWGSAWHEMVAHAVRTLGTAAPSAAAVGLVIAIEDHQDFGSEELVAMAEAAGPNVGVTFDTGNAFAVGEDPVAFARRVAHRTFHLHLKDYRAVFTDEGYRLVRCAIGDGAVPFEEIARALGGRAATVTTSLEPGALEARHIRLFTPDWWQGYGPRDASELGVALGRLRAAAIADDEPWQTPWERQAPPSEIVAYELADVRRSAAIMRQRYGA